ncbi:MAG TPA: tRNA (guanosine(37)-N1)-methyltransferase TrmD [Firmicutes bacterium]|uniref:tRNA (guanine-N(1)-)-methyltransferase n=1 Tax=Capillibacterium thermochitinicola TaxID=2699427 RepID=A0A8J6I113_9FIRM|nr:tRNA (guanosine(37)-N1)-methyltransferase TrmD [Capillibacterium thermochitinicola]MBA2133481.1 tRNA (guanosine(37)-N1)-methyltransferase TrmD [Capillibacterium thermochitinicola]HHW12832.1 tRNA (guanosine(37)-N1)-methyltransferase TrmD [Bacillota bacterium]
MLIQFLTLFPEMFDGPFAHSMIKRAQDNGLVKLETINFRAYAEDRHATVDDTPYGGGPGMILKPEPIFKAVEAIQAQAATKPYIILTTPQGEIFHQRIAVELSAQPHLVFICGHYEGYDERIRTLADRELSIGDYILTGGELPAMVMAEAIIRLLPGVLGDPDAARLDSFSGPEGILDYPQYTKPADFRGLKVPAILLSGDHGKIAQWRREQALLRTARRRPDLLAQLALTAKEKELIESYRLARADGQPDFASEGREYDEPD